MDQEWVTQALGLVRISKSTKFTVFRTEGCMGSNLVHEPNLVNCIPNQVTITDDTLYVSLAINGTRLIVMYFICVGRLH